MLDEERDEALEATVNRAVDDDWPMTLLVVRHVFEVEPLGKLVVELDRRTLPAPPNGVRNMDVDLRAVERGLARLDLIGDVVRLERHAQVGFGHFPGRHLTQVLLRIPR